MGKDLDNTIAVFGRWLHLPSTTALHATLGAVAAHQLPGAPVWLLTVGAPSSGKTEPLDAMMGLDDVYGLSTLTEAALLSASPKREKSETATGGLLREIGSSGIIVAKDFGSILSMHKESSGQVLAALREIYDGRWDRHVGTDGGETLHWSGRVSFLGGVTQTIERHHAVMGALGERFMLTRLPPTDERAQASQALKNAGKEKQMKAELSEAVLALFDNTVEPPELNDDDFEQLVSLASLAVRCRSAVERDNYGSREIEFIPDAEHPARFAKALASLTGGLRSIGADEETVWRVVRSVALDSIPAARRAFMVELLARRQGSGMRELCRATGYPLTTTRRTLEDLAAHKVIERAGESWRITQWTIDAWAATGIRDLGYTPKNTS
ncbi:MAG TPA: helix-turn-helix domain-containing protein [Solirubrobacteraceae bacterium]|jgi:hypothetical protein